MPVLHRCATFFTNGAILKGHFFWENANSLMVPMHKNFTIVYIYEAYE